MLTHPHAQTPVLPKLQPLVSILINNYNYGRYLNEAIVSALNQTYPAVEVIVVDDGSTDRETEAVLATYAGERSTTSHPVRVIRKPNGGQASAFNAGFAASQGEIICFLDADDFFAPDKVAQVVAVLATEPSLGWCFHPLAMMDHATRTYAPPEVYQGATGVYDLTRWVRRGKLQGGLPFTGTATSGICFRRSLLTQLLPMPEAIRITSDDYLKYAALALTPGYIILESLTSQRLHGDNAYTQRSDKRLLFAQISVLTAYWLRRKFPVMQAFCDNLFASGINFYPGFRQVSGPDRPLVKAYLKETALWQRLQIYLKVLYYRCRS